MQQLLEHPADFVCFYLGPVNASWRASGRETLVDQGWALLPATSIPTGAEPSPDPPVNVIPANVQADKDRAPRTATTR